MIEERLLIYLIVFLLLLLFIYWWIKPQLQKPPQNTGGYTFPNHKKMTGGEDNGEYELKDFNELLEMCDQQFFGWPTVCKNSTSGEGANACYTTALFNAILGIMGKDMYEIFSYDKTKKDPDGGKRYIIPSNVITKKFNVKVQDVDKRKFEKNLNDKFILAIHSVVTEYKISIAHFSEIGGFTPPTLMEVIKSPEYYLPCKTAGLVLETVDKDSKPQEHYLAAWFRRNDQQSGEQANEWIVINDGTIDNRDNYSTDYVCSDSKYGKYLVRFIIVPNDKKMFVPDYNINKISEALYDNEFVDDILMKIVNEFNSMLVKMTKFPINTDKLLHLTIYKAQGQDAIHEVINDIKDIEIEQKYFVQDAFKNEIDKLEKTCYLGVKNNEIVALIAKLKVVSGIKISKEEEKVLNGTDPNNEVLVEVNDERLIQP